MNIPYISAEEVRKNLSMEDAIQYTENVYKLKSQAIFNLLCFYSFGALCVFFPFSLPCTLLTSSLAVSRSIAGCGVSHIGKVSVGRRG